MAARSGQTGSVSSGFENVGEIVYPLAAGSEEAIMEAAIEAGASDVVTDADGHYIYTARADLAEVAGKLEASIKAEPTSTNLIWKPLNTVCRVGRPRRHADAHARTAGRSRRRAERLQQLRTLRGRDGPPGGIGGGVDGVVIRRADLSDAAAMSVYVDGLKAEGLDTIGLNRSISIAEEEDFIAKANAAERAFFLLAFDGGSVVGILDLAAGQRHHDRHGARIGMSVARDWRGKGVGRRLLETAIDEVRNWPGFCRIELEVVPWNAPAIALYESVGFVHEARKQKATALRGQPEDVLLMALVW